MRSSLLIQLLGCLVFCSSLGYSQSLPPDAKIGIWRLPPSQRFDQKTTVSGVFKEHLLGNDALYEVVFYSVPNPLADEAGCIGCRADIVRITDPEGRVVHEFCPGNRIEGHSEQLLRKTTLTTPFLEPSGLRILGKGQLPTVVSFTYVGNAGFFLDLFRWDGQVFRHLNGDWHRTVQIDGIEFRDLDGDHVQEVIILHKRRRSVEQWGNQTVYRWNGEVYERAKTD